MGTESTASSTVRARFEPRPEARAMTWGELFLPVQDAAAEMLARIQGAEMAADRRGPDVARREVSSCFLVYGDRGTGKTTVLLSAQKAVARPEDFFSTPATGGPKREELWQEARSAAHYLGPRLCWLDVLDAEPLPPKANLLTALLVRVQGALDAGREDERSASVEGIERQRVSALFDEGAEGAARQIGALLRDASLIWEDIQEQDTRARAERQIAAAQIYASFRRRFLRAMEAVSDHLRRHRQKTSILLPIDNIDRSTDHLYSIIKLAQLVSCRHLWLVLAGDRIDIDAFLQRAYWKELIKTGEGAVVRGRERVAGEDEALSIARRQAAASGAKAIPISHRIKVKLVLADEAFASSGPGGEGKTLADKLTRLPLFRDARQAESREDVWPRTLGELIHIAAFLHDSLSERVPGKKDRLSFAGWLALRLPVRSLIDLHQLLDGVPDGEVKDKDITTTQVLRRMLQHAVDRADLPEWASKRLLELVLGRDNRGRTVLWLDGMRAADTTADLAELRASPGDGDAPVEVRVHMEEQIDVRVSLRRSPRSGEAVEEEVILPPSVAGWLMLLHDALAFSDHPVLFSTSPGDLVRAPPVTTRHSLPLPEAPELQVHWPSPEFGTFWEADLFRLLWKDALTARERGHGAEGSAPPRSAAELSARWIDSVLQVAFAGARRRRAPREALSEVLSDVPVRRKRAEGFVDLCSWKAAQSRAMSAWVEERLPLLLLPEVAPAAADGARDAEVQLGYLERVPVRLRARILAARRRHLREPVLAAAASATGEVERRTAFLGIEEYLNRDVPGWLRLRLDWHLAPAKPGADERPSPDEPAAVSTAAAPT